LEQAGQLAADFIGQTQETEFDALLLGHGVVVHGLPPELFQEADLPA
jgi:hypothetical protein